MGTIALSKVSNLTGKVDYTYTQDVLTNKTTITTKVYAIKTVSEATYGKSWYGEITVNGTKHTFGNFSSTTYVSNKYVLFGTFTDVIEHNLDGTKTIRIDCWYHGPSGTSKASTKPTGGADVILDKIDRESYISNESISSTYVGNGSSLGSDINLTIVNPANLYLKLRVCGDQTDLSAKTVTLGQVTTLNNFNLDCDEMTDLIYYCKAGAGDAITITPRMIIDTYLDSAYSTLISSKSYSNWTIALTSMLPSHSSDVLSPYFLFGDVSTKQKYRDVTGNTSNSVSKIIKDISLIKVKYDIIIKNPYKTSLIYIDGQEATADIDNNNYYITTTVTSSTSAGQKSFTVGGYDLRGNSISGTSNSIPLMDYIKLTNNNNSRRSGFQDGGTYTISISGAYFNGNFGAENNTLTGKYKLYPKGTTPIPDYTNFKGVGETDPEIVISGNTFTITKTITNIDYDTEYIFVYEIADKIVTYNTGNIAISVGTPILAWSNDSVFINGKLYIKGTEIYPIGSVIRALDGVDMTSYCGYTWTKSDTSISETFDGTTEQVYSWKRTS